jgi:hypothetical protein
MRRRNESFRIALWLLAAGACCLLLDQVLRGAPGDATNRTRLLLSWDASPTAEQVTGYRLYGETNVSGTNWIVLTNIAGGTTTNVSVPLVQLPGWSSGYRGPFILTLTASNFWGESSFSDVVSAPRLPSSDSAIRISAAP